MLNSTYLQGIRSNWRRAWNGNLTALESKYRTDGRALVVAACLKPKQLEIVSRPNEERRNEDHPLGDEGCENVIPDILDGYERVYPVGFKPADGETKLDRVVFQASYSDIRTHLDAHAIVTLAKAAGITRVYAKNGSSSAILHNEDGDFVGLLMPIWRG